MLFAELMNQHVISSTHVLIGVGDSVLKHMVTLILCNLVFPYCHVYKALTSHVSVCRTLNSNLWVWYPLILRFFVNIPNINGRQIKPLCPVNVPISQFFAYKRVINLVHLHSFPNLDLSLASNKRRNWRG